MRFSMWVRADLPVRRVTVWSMNFGLGTGRNRDNCAVRFYSPSAGDAVGVGVGNQLTQRILCALQFCEARGENIRV